MLFWINHNYGYYYLQNNFHEKRGNENMLGYPVSRWGKVIKRMGFLSSNFRNSVLIILVGGSFKKCPMLENHCTVGEKWSLPSTQWHFYRFAKKVTVLRVCTLAPHLYFYYHFCNCVCWYKNGTPNVMPRWGKSCPRMGRKRRTLWKDLQNGEGISSSASLNISFASTFSLPFCSLYPKMKTQCWKC